MKTIQINQESSLVYSLLQNDNDGMWTINVEDNKYIQLVEWQQKADLLQAELFKLLMGD